MSSAQASAHAHDPAPGDLVLQSFSYVRFRGVEPVGGL